MKPKTLVLSVLAVLLLAVAAWQMMDRGDAADAPGQLVTAAEPQAAPVTLPEPAAVAPAIESVDVPVAAATARPPIKRTQLPNGTILIENQPMTIRTADGRVEERLIRMIARPSKKDMPVMKRTLPKMGEDATIAPEDAATESPESVETTTTTVVTPPATGESGSTAPAGGTVQPPKTGG